MEAQAKNLRCDPANSLVKLAANPQAPLPAGGYPQMNVAGISDEFAHSTKMDMANIC